MVDAVVVGAGVIGASIARELSREGCRVVVVDAGAEPAAGCSHANAGLLVPSHANPLTGAANVRTGISQLVRGGGSVRIAARAFATSWMRQFLLACRPEEVATATRHLRTLGAHSLSTFQTHAETLPASGVTQHGMLDVFGDAETLDRAAASACGAGLGMAVERLSAEEVRARVPGVLDVAGGLLFPDEAHCDGKSYTDAVLTDARRMGAAVCWNTGVRRLITRTGRIAGVDTDRGPLEAGIVVVAAGTSSHQVVAGAGGPRLLTMAAKGYVVDLPRTPDDPALPVGLVEDHLVVTPYVDRTRIAGILELGNTDLTPDPRRTQEVVAAVRTRLPTLSAAGPLMAWAGLRPCSADGLPYVGAVPTVEGLHVAAGHGQQGVLLAPVTAEIVADGVLGRTSSIPEPVVRALAPDRHHRRRGRGQRDSSAR